MSRVPRPDTAFSLDGTGMRRRPRRHSEAHLIFIRGLPCVVPGCRVAIGVHAAHLRGPAPQWGKRSTGMGEKPDDIWTVPICPDHHVFGKGAQHSMSEQAFWAAHRVDPFTVALALWACTGDLELGQQIIRIAKQ